MKPIYVVAVSIITVLFLVSMVLHVAPVIISVSMGLSMFPTIRSGDLLICVHKDYIPVTNGSIAGYRNGMTNVVHRVVDIRGSIYVFRGDNNILNEYVPSSKVVCRVVGIVPAYVWVPAVALLFSLGVVYITKKSDRHTYGASSIVIAFAVVTLVIVLTNLALMFTDVYVVKPNPLPVITYVRKGTAAVEVRLSTQPDGYITCFSSQNVPVSCYVDGTKILIEGFREHTLKIAYKPRSPYNVTVVYEVEMK